MKSYIILLRGINISGQKIIKMAELKAAMEEVGFQEVKTYIQSGNIVFNHEDVPIVEVEDKVRKKIKNNWGYDVPVKALTIDEMKSVIIGNPFSNDPGKEEKRTYFTFLSNIPTPEKQQWLKEVDHSPEKVVLLGETIYFHSPESYGKAKMNNNFFEKTLEVTATTRNWNTVNKLVELATSLPQNTTSH